jgi:hypothetical protein
MMAENDDLTTGDENNPAIPDPGTVAGGADLPTEVAEEPGNEMPLPLSTVPTVPIEATGPGSSAAVPPMPGRTFNDGVTSSAPAVPAPAVAADVGVAEIRMVDPGKEKEITAQITDTFRDGLADTLGVARETLAEGAAYFAPMIARQALLQTSADPKVSARAAGHLRHLKGQLLMRAGERGIPLQQRQEQRVLGVMTTVLAIAVRFATGGVA